MLWLISNTALTLKKSTAAGAVEAVGIAKRFPRACGIPKEFQAIVDPVLWDPHERQARQIPQRGQPSATTCSGHPLKTRKDQKYIYGNAGSVYLYT